jgi:hypothetical protein
VLKVTDFGLAYYIAAGAEISDFGTPEYVSPETAAGVASDHRGDIYSLAATLYHMLAGRPVFTAPTPEAILQKHVHEAVPAIEKYNLQAGRAIGRILEKALAKKPSARYQNYESFIADLDNVIRERAAIAKPPEPLVRPAFVVVTIVIVGLAVATHFYWQSLDRPATPVATNATVVTPSVTRTQVVGVTPPVPVGPTADDEAMAANVAAALNAQADPLLAAGKLREAYALYEQWPAQPIHAKTLANDLVRQQRARLRQLAAEQWDKVRQQTQALGQQQRYDEAVKLCDEAIPVYDGFAECLALIRAERKRLLADKKKHEEALATAAQATRQQQEAKLNELRAATGKLIVALRWDEAAKALREAASTAEPALQARIRELQELELDPILAMRQGILTRCKAKPGPTLALATRTGNLEGQLLTDDAGRLCVGQISAYGTVSKPIPWEELTPGGVLRVYATGMDATSAVEQTGYALLLAHFAQAGQAPLDAARRELTALAQRDPPRQAVVESFLNRFAETERRLQEEAAVRAAAAAREARAALLWGQLDCAVGSKDLEAGARELRAFLAEAKDTEFARQHAVDIERLQRTFPGAEGVATVMALDQFIGNRRLIHTAEDTDEGAFDDTVVGLATSGYLRKNNVAKHGLPDDGKLVVRVGDQRIPFHLRLGQGADATVLQIGTSRETRLQSGRMPWRDKRFRTAAVLFAGIRGSADLIAEADYGPDNKVRFTLSAWSCHYEPRLDTKDAAVVPVTAADKTRVILGVRLVPLDGTLPLRNLKFRIEDERGSATPPAVAILAVSLLPAK